jgi:hypothetical protein
MMIQIFAKTPESLEESKAILSLIQKEVHLRQIKMLSNEVKRNLSQNKRSQNPRPNQTKRKTKRRLVL